MHLTGLEYVNSEGKVQNNAIDFYNKCIKNILVEEEIRFKADGTTSLKIAKEYRVARLQTIA